MPGTIFPESRGGRVCGIGVDLVDTARIRQSVEEWGERFKERVFLPAEQTYCESKAEPWVHYAACFAAKEAVSKALGVGIGEFAQWLEIEVTHAASGRPLLVLTGCAAACAARLGATEWQVSISHTREQAIAFVVLTG